MSDFKVIESAVAATARRRRWERGWRGLWLGVLIGSLVWLATLLTYKLLPVSITFLAVGGAAGFLSMLIGFLVGGWRKPSMTETARWIDARHNLKERLSSALEVSSRDNEWSALVVRDAARHVEAVDIRRLMPWHLPRAARWAVLVLALGAGLGFVPEYRTGKHLQKQAEAANIKDAGKQLAELTKRSMEMRPPALEPTQKAMTSVAELGQMFEKTPLTRGEALRDLANAAEKLSKQAQELARDPSLKPLERAARESAATAGKTPEALQRQIDSMQKSLGNDKATPDALEKMRADLEKAQQKASSLPDKGTAAGKAARDQLAQSLSALAREAAEMGHPLDSLNEAIASLEKNAIDQVLKNLDVASTDLEKLKSMAKALAQLQQQASKMGKDLAEQLENGQAEAARGTLDKMVEQMKSAGLNAEQLQKMLDEVSKAVAPAGEYGKVAEHLKDAVKQMQQAGKSGSEAAKAQAAQSLAQAAKELEKLAQQMGDMQALASTLDALGRAEQMIATGQGWGQCNKPGSGACSLCGGKGCSACKGKGWGHGGGLSASGVGTWADEQEGWTYYPDKISQTPVDNSGVQRPDMDSRGVSDRGPGEVSDALKPTKVKGKMSQGSQMPSITLKGVSIKGKSTVAFTEAAAAAQSDAQNALNQDQVPRPYQNAVKDYFDDLKK